MGKFYQRFNKVVNGIENFIEKFCGGVMGLLMIAVLVQVIYRFIIVKLTGKSFPYTDEFSRLALIWVSYLILAVGLRKGDHVSFNLIVDRLPPLGQKIVFVFNRLLILGFGLTVVIYGLKLISMMKFMITPTLQISVGFQYAAPTIGCLMLSIRVIMQIIDVIFFPENLKVEDDDFQTNAQLESRGVV